MPGYLVEDIRELKNRTQVYYFVVHRYREGEKWKMRKCSIGSEGYIYVSKTHKLPLLGVSIEFSNIFDTRKHAELALKSLRNLEQRLKWIQNNHADKYREEAKKVKNTILEMEKILQRLKSMVHRAESEQPMLFPNLETR